MPDTHAEADNLYAQGRACRLNGDYDKAIALLQRALAFNPKHADARCELGLAYCFTGLFDESIGELKHAAALAPNNQEIHMHLAKMHTMLGNYEEGAAAFRRVLALCKPGSDEYIEAFQQLSYLE